MATMVRGALTPAKTEHYRRQILNKIREVRLGLSARRAAEFVSRPEEPLDFGDWCQKSHDEWLFLNQNRIELALLRELEAALARVDEGSFGVCQGCGEPISERRLEAVPWASFCIPCQEHTRHAEES
jgi:RNA polymerase-binding protein DksA